jgi:hypothetical protein
VRFIVDCVEPSEVHRYESLGWCVDIGVKNGFGCYVATRFIDEYETYCVSNYSEIKPEHRN